MYRLIAKHDSAAIQEVLHATYDSFTDESISGAAGAWLHSAHQNDKLGTSDMFCEETSDAVTRAAHRLGIMAARERHRYIDSEGERSIHCITSFGPLAANPSDNDLIMCLTWGQFNPNFYNDPANPLGGRPLVLERGEIANLPLEYGAFAAQTIVERQIIYRRQEGYALPFAWQPTTVDEVAQGIVQPGEIV